MENISVRCPIRNLIKRNLAEPLARWNQEALILFFLKTKTFIDDLLFYIVDISFYIINVLYLLFILIYKYLRRRRPTV